MGEVGPQKIPLCLQCWALLQGTVQKQSDALREEMNYIHDSIDSMFGISTGARYPLKRSILVAGSTVNHIAINDSQIGILNTSNIQNLDQTIDTLYSVSQIELAENIKKFSEAILSEQGLSKEQQSEVLESLDVITKELFQKSENRKKTVIKTLMSGISETISVTANSLTIWQILQPLLQKFLQL
ncbi:MAG: hypothetical protein A2805_01585 [Candidatus Andersenbacteria bacterium RIFCSPHIGHO2_01_FULL_46_36]|nr:MAG: hypothetical protein A2805_01585 [Candidatus Andersenbacteria bacterium RIFCSPHIGHO2_01_FULL_46_36]